MQNEELIEQLKKNILSVSWSMQDAPYHGFSSDKIKGVNFAVEKILEGTEITIQSLLQECEEKKWFRHG